MTGRYSIHQGVHTPFVDSSPNALPLDEVLLLQKLREVGYRTIMVGKWHLGFAQWAHTPTYRGFDYFYGYYAGSQDYWNHESLCWAGNFSDGCFQSKNNGEPVTGLDFHRNRETVRNETGSYSTDLFAQEAIRQLKAHAANEPETPLFLYLPLQAVHVANAPVPSHPEYWLDQAPREYIEPYDYVQNAARRNLSAMVSAMDEAVGNVTDALKESGLWEDTLFIFSTDNGGPTNMQASNYPLRKGKGSNYEGGVRGIGFVNGGSRVGLSSEVRGTVNQKLMHVTDWMPTICEVAGCRMNGTKPLDGVPAWKAITEKAYPSSRNEIVHDIWLGKAAIRVGDYKLIIDKPGTAAQLYNVIADVGEHTDLAARMPEKLKELHQRLLHWNSTAAGDIAHQLAPPMAGANPLNNGGVWMPWM